MAEQSNIGIRPTEAVTTDFGAIAHQGMQGMVAKEERERLQREREEQKRLEFEDRYGLDEDLMVLEDTEFRTVNDATTEALSKYRDRYYDVYKKLQQDPSNIDLKKRLSSITNSVKRMRASHDKFVQLGDQGLQMISEGKMSGVDEETWRQQLEAYDEGRIRVNVDDNDNMQFLFYDKEGKMQQVVPYNQFIKEGLYSKVDVQEEVQGMLKLIGRDKYDQVTGSFIKTVDKWGVSQEQQARELVQSQLESDEVIADILNQATGSKKRTGFSAEEKQMAENYLVSKVRNAYSEASSISERRAAPQPTTAQLKQPSLTKLSVAKDDQGGALMRDDKAIITYQGGIQVDPSGEGAVYDQLRVNANGNLELHGSKKVKMKGVEPTETLDISAIAEKTGKDERLITGERNANGTYTYYLSDSRVARDEETINKFANLIGAGNVENLRGYANRLLADEFGEDNVRAFYQGKIKNKPSTKETQQAPDTMFEGLSIEDLNGVDVQSLDKNQKKAYYLARAKKLSNK